MTEYGLDPGPIHGLHGVGKKRPDCSVSHVFDIDNKNSNTATQRSNESFAISSPDSRGLASFQKHTCYFQHDAFGKLQAPDLWAA
jgi:hypothetical protein